ncbi:MAG TPA: hypothetical protein VNK95_13725, partial [Caldilineaceae bacterium]|nr:hypothetical protein [Caldilineaceae bacterium]
MSHVNRVVLQVILLAALLFAPPAAGAQAVEPSGHEQTKISPHLQAQLAESSGPVEFLVILKEQPDLTGLAARAQAMAAVAAAGPEAQRAARIGYVYATLSADAASSQAELRAWLDAQGIAYRAFYLVNMIQVSGDETLAAALAARPDVDR